MFPLDAAEVDSHHPSPHIRARKVETNLEIPPIHPSLTALPATASIRRVLCTAYAPLPARPRPAHPCPLPPFLHHHLWLTLLLLLLARSLNLPAATSIQQVLRTAYALLPARPHPAAAVLDLEFCKCVCAEAELPVRVSFPVLELREGGLACHSVCSSFARVFQYMPA
ncbi:hypothetical protein LshimejAT787_0100650 [Lyophyllum shimeji]|uniref:Uncharacterized protein n=1 Tax=Lyophyllum shimeji TaxID=47721 RepID=A0A9P3PC92_LYOSH|nr:hypothetical protein LshimejAT787_0100650 [Lyophyllum shimeji]